jgi:NADH-ubiquinone oxidoreductase chain 6
MVDFILNSFAFLALLFAILVITSKNPVISIVYLVGVFMVISLILILLGIKFIGLSYIIVYIGAISVLFLFIIMMIDIKSVDILDIGKEYSKNLPLALLIGILFIYSIFILIPILQTKILLKDFLLFNLYNILVSFNFFFLDELQINNSIIDGFGFMDVLIFEFSNIVALGLELYTAYGSLFIIISLILLIAMLALIFISRKK